MTAPAVRSDEGNAMTARGHKRNHNMKSGGSFLIRALLTTAAALCLRSGCGCILPVRADEPVHLPSSMVRTGSMPLSYADQFSVDYYDGGCALIKIHSEYEYLLVEEDAEIPDGLPEEITVLKKPLEHIYAASSSCPDFFRELGGMDKVTMTSTKAEDWTIPVIRDAVSREDMIYVGKYSAPDYEYICDEGCDLAIENTMIYHAPEVSEMLERLEIPVMTEYSSYEEEPLGRLEWIRLYGVLTGREKEADAFFEEQVSGLKDVLSQSRDDGESRPDEETGQTEGSGQISGRVQTGDTSGTDVVFFYIGTNGTVNVRRENDYVTRMIEMAGGRYMLHDLVSSLPSSESGSGSVNLQMESFYAAAKDADVLIYNGTLGESLGCLEDLLAKNPLLADFKAVKDGRVYCSRDSLFQEVTGTCRMVMDLNRVICMGDGEDDEELTYIQKLR